MERYDGDLANVAMVRLVVDVQSLDFDGEVKQLVACLEDCSVELRPDFVVQSYEATVLFECMEHLLSG